jgi:hypothetical protein
MKTCPDCAEKVQDAAQKCRYCGYEFASDTRPPSTPPKSGKPRSIVTVAAVLLVAGAVVATGFATGVVGPASDGGGGRSDEDAERAQRERDRARGERLLEQRAVFQLEEAITEDAQDTVEEGLLPGPAIQRTQCQPTGEDSGQVQNYDCLAVNEESGGTLSGYGYDASINGGTLRWELSD